MLRDVIDPAQPDNEKRGPGGHAVYAVKNAAVARQKPAAVLEAGIALALVLMLFHRSGSLDLTFWQDLREEGVPAFVDREVPEERAEDQVWPTLTPAGVEPEVDEDELLHRSRV